MVGENHLNRGRLDKSDELEHNYPWGPSLVKILIYVKMLDLNCEFRTNEGDDYASSHHKRE